VNSASTAQILIRRAPETFPRTHARSALFSPVGVLSVLAVAYARSAWFAVTAWPRRLKVRESWAPHTQGELPINPHPASLSTTGHSSDGAQPLNPNDGA